MWKPIRIKLSILRKLSSHKAVKSLRSLARILVYMKITRVAPYKNKGRAKHVAVTTNRAIGYIDKVNRARSEAIKSVCTHG